MILSLNIRINHFLQCSNLGRLHVPNQAVLGILTKDHISLIIYFTRFYHSFRLFNSDLLISSIYALLVIKCIASFLMLWQFIIIFQKYPKSTQYLKMSAFPRKVMDHQYRIPRYSNTLRRLFIGGFMMGPPVGYAICKLIQILSENNQHF